jgi:hypothetical protein
VIANSWDKLLKSSQKEAREFLASSQKKNLDGSKLFAFFNKRLVSLYSLLTGIRISIASFWLRVTVIPCRR